MKLTSILLAAMLAGAYHSNAQTWIHDTISTEAGYLKNVYYSLEKGETAKVDADNWHIGFSVGAWSASIITNSADNGVKLYEISSNISDFGTDLRSNLANAMTATPMSLYNSNLSWEVGAFNQNSGNFPNYGWGDYDIATHWISGNRIFGLISGTDTFQVLIVDKQVTPLYNFKIANIDGTNQKTKQLTLDAASPYSGRYFAYYNITTDAFLNREPLVTDWDFVFSNYNDENVVFANEQYKVFGIINNEGLKVARVDTADAEFDNIAPHHATYFYDTVNNSIGRAWKASGPSGTVANDSLCYFIKKANGDVWQLVFTAHNSGLATVDPGLVALKKRKVSTATTVRNLNNDIALFQVYPNPAVNDVTVLIDAKQRVENTQIFITDMTGKVVYRGNANVNAGLNAISVSTANLANGNYIVAVTNGKWNATQKLVVQH